MKKILIIEDDREIAELECDYLEAADFAVDIAADGNTGRDLALSGGYALVLLDLMLPGLDGFAVCRALREQLDIPVIVVSARQADIDKIRTFGLGADDYLTKPFSPGEMVARVRMHISRYDQLTHHPSGQTPVVHQLHAGSLVLEPETHRVYRGPHDIVLAHKEFELLKFLMENPGIVFSREVLFEKIWGMDSLGDTATVAVHINRLRDKIDCAPDRPSCIETVRGAGYLSGRIENFIYANERDCEKQSRSFFPAFPSKEKIS